MISRIAIEGFKSLEKVDLTLGSLNLFVGANTSGKSNFFDALRVLQAVAYGYTVDEIFNGKPRTAESEAWERIRGGSAKAAFIGGTQAGPTQPAPGIRFQVELGPAAAAGYGRLRYTIRLSAELGCVREETLEAEAKPLSFAYSSVLDSTPFPNDPASPSLQVRYYRGTQGRQPSVQLEKARPAIHQMLRHPECPEELRDMIGVVIAALGNTQRLDPSPAVLREYSQARKVTRMGEHGENFAALVDAIMQDEATRSAYVSWLQQLTPAEIDDVTVLRGAIDDSLFAVRERGVDFPAPILSDGTLRFAAIAAAFFQPSMPSILTVEEIENAIHPSRLRLLVELLRSQATRDRQIMATTHSPVVLAWLEEPDYDTTFFCQRDEDTGASQITPLSKIPHLLDTVRKHSLADLFAEGWLEGAL